MLSYLPCIEHYCCLEEYMPSAICCPDCLCESIFLVAQNGPEIPEEWKALPCYLLNHLSTCDRRMISILVHLNRELCQEQCFALTKYDISICGMPEQNYICLLCVPIISKSRYILLPIFLTNLPSFKRLKFDNVLFHINHLKLFKCVIKKGNWTFVFKVNTQQLK